MPDPAPTQPEALSEEGLREIEDRPPWQTNQIRKDVATLLAELRRVRASIEEMHYRADYTNGVGEEFRWCMYCMLAWPCPTLRIIRGSDA